MCEEVLPYPFPPPPLFIGNNCVCILVPGLGGVFFLQDFLGRPPWSELVGIDVASVLDGKYF